MNSLVTTFFIHIPIPLDYRITKSREEIVAHILLPLIILPVLIPVWWLAGKCMPPASDIDLDAINDKNQDTDQLHPEKWETKFTDSNKESSRQKPQPIDIEDLKLTEGVTFREQPVGEEMLPERRVTIASNQMYSNGPPPLNTVSVRSGILKLAFVIICLVLWRYYSEFSPSEWFKNEVLDNPIFWCLISIFGFFIAALLGSFRQFCSTLLARAGAVAALDEFGQPIFIYIGHVPMDIWLQSPWFRAITWVVVSLLSVIAAVVGAIFLEKWLEKEMLTQTILIILALRWMISALPRFFHLFSPSENNV